MAAPNEESAAYWIRELLINNYKSVCLFIMKYDNLYIINKGA